MPDETANGPLPAKQERRLLDSQTLAHALLNVPYTASMLITPDGIILDANNTLAQLFGKDLPDVIGKPIWDLFPPDVAARRKIYLDEAIKTKKAVRFEDVRSGLWSDFIISPLLDDAGNVTDVAIVATDINERKRIEKELLESEQRLRFHVERSPLAVIEWDMNFIVTRWSGAAEKIFGWSAAETIGKPILDLHMIFEEDMPLVQKTMERLTSGSSTNVISNNRNYTKKRQVIHCEWYNSVLTDQQGKMISVMSQVLDVTERKQSEQELKESREQLRTVVEKSPFAMALVSMRGDIEYINLKAIETFGYLPQDIPTMDRWWEQAYPDRTYREQVVSRWMGLVNEALLNKHEIEKREYRVTCKDGGIKFVTIFGVWVGDRVLAVFDDITERKHAEQALSESEEKFRSLFDNSEIAMFRTRLDGTEVLDVNQKWLDLVGKTREQVLGKPSVIVWEDPKEREKMVGILLAEGSVSDFEFNMLSTEKGVRNCITSLRLYREQGILEGSIADITERKHLEEQFLRAQKLESVGTLAGGIAHDFNNLLQGVFGYISLAKMTISDKEKCTVSLERAEKVLHQTVNLTNQLLTFSKGGKPAKKFIDLRPVIENSARFMLSGSRADLRLTIPKDLWQVEADEGQIGQVIQNIVLNADQSMPIGGTVSIAASNVAKSGAALPPGLDKVDYVLIAIQDTGIGIPDQYLSKIFDPYFTTKVKGSGLGLATSYSIIKNHNGMIDVRTKSGFGSAFMIYLPATARSIRQEPAATPYATAPSKRARILVMDDEEVIRNISSELLDALGHDVEVAEHGQAALEKYQRAHAAGRPFDIVILDLTVRGGMGGVETIRKLLAMDPKIKAIVSSGYSDDAATANYLAQGFKASLKKPYNVDALKDLIHTVLDS